MQESKILNGTDGTYQRNGGQGTREIGPKLHYSPEYLLADGLGIEAEGEDM